MRPFLLALALLTATPAGAQPILETAAVPYLDAPSRASYAQFLVANLPRALAISPNGKLGWFSGAAKIEDARALKTRTDTPFPLASKIVLEQDSRSTHKPASLYMAECAFSVLSCQYLDRRVPDKGTLTKEVTAWRNHRNKTRAMADRQSTTADARIKLKRLYPTL